MTRKGNKRIACLCHLSLLLLHLFFLLFLYCGTGVWTQGFEPRCSTIWYPLSRIFWTTEQIPLGLGDSLDWSLMLIIQVGKIFTDLFTYLSEHMAQIGISCWLEKPSEDFKLAGTLEFDKAKRTAASLQLPIIWLPPVRRVESHTVLP
jgi:hypothetical protein